MCGTSVTLVENLPLLSLAQCIPDFRKEIVFLFFFSAHLHVPVPFVLLTQLLHSALVMFENLFMIEDSCILLDWLVSSNFMP